MNSFKCSVILLIVVAILGGCSLPFASNEPLESEAPINTVFPENDELMEDATGGYIYGASEVVIEEAHELHRMSLLLNEIYEEAEKEPSSSGYYDSIIDQETIDAMEDVLIREGYPIINSGGDYPNYLEHADGIYTFGESVSSSRDDETAYWSVAPSGGLYYWVLQFVDGQGYRVSAAATWNEEGSLEFESAEKREVLHWDMTYNNDFYYQAFPADRHWDAATLLRLKPVDKDLYDLTAKCILPIGYHNVNMFLCDWNTSDYGELCFNDLFEGLYELEYNGYANPSDYDYEDDPYWHACIPADIFEGTILPYFDIALDDFREKTLYNTEKDIYPWQEVSASNIMYFPSVIPEVTKAIDNADGSITLTVNVMCLDKQTDCLFIHEVTIKPLDNGRFLYLGNEIVYTGEHALPSSRPRIPAQHRG